MGRAQRKRIKVGVKRVGELGFGDGMAELVAKMIAGMRAARRKVLVVCIGLP